MSARTTCGASDRGFCRPGPFSLRHLLHSLRFFDEQGALVDMRLLLGDLFIRVIEALESDQFRQLLLERTSVRCREAKVADLEFDAPSTRASSCPRARQLALAIGLDQWLDVLGVDSATLLGEGGRALQLGLVVWRW